MRIDLVNQQYNSNKFAFDSGCLGIALGFASPLIANKCMIYYHNGIDILNDTLNGINIQDASASNFTITKTGVGDLALSVSNGALSLTSSLVGPGCNIGLTVTDATFGTINLIGGTINLSPDIKTLTDKDIEISDTTMGVVMTARWTDSGHSAPGIKKFRIYVELDDGTISVEEV